MAIISDEGEGIMGDRTFDPLGTSPATANGAAHDEGKYQPTERKDNIDYDYLLRAIIGKIEDLKKEQNKNCDDHFERIEAKLMEQEKKIETVE